VIDWAAPKVRWPMTDDMIKAEKQINDSPMTGGARFTEIMDGYIYIGDDITNYECAVNTANGSESTARFYLSVDAWDINALKYKDNHAAMLTGTFSAGALSSDPFMVLRGEFQLFSDDPNTPDTHNLVYDFDMISVYPADTINFRHLVKSFTFTGTRSLILLLHSALLELGKLLPRYTSPSPVRMDL
jgi:hypothetical protein